MSKYVSGVSRFKTFESWRSQLRLTLHHEHLQMVLTALTAS